MSQIFTLDRIKGPSADPWLAGTVILMTGLGLGVLFSASHFAGARLLGDPFHFVLRQLIGLGVGAAAAWVVSLIPLEVLRRWIPAFLMVSLVLMGLTFLPWFSRPIMGARNWLILGPLTFQPSELVKLSLVLYLAHYLAGREGQLDRFKDNILPPLLVVALFTGLVLAQNDYAVALFVLVLGLMMFFLAGLQMRYFLPLLIFGGPLALIFLFTRSYRVERIISFFNPESDPTGMGYQILAARRALMEGGLWGRGWGGGIRKLGQVPEVQADFILAVLGEEGGFWALLILFSLFAFLAWRGFQLCFRTEDRFHFYLAFGLTASLILQFLVNAGVVSGTIPATGLTLPFFSAGGSSLMLSLVTVGLLLNLSRRREGLR